MGIGANCDTEAETEMDLINCQLCGCKMQSDSHWYLGGCVCLYTYTHICIYIHKIYLKDQEKPRSEESLIFFPSKYITCNCPALYANLGSIQKQIYGFAKARGL